MQDYCGFTRAIGNPKKLHTIRVTFTDGQKANYTIGMLPLLKTDFAVAEIMDNETGEILYSK